MAEELKACPFCGGIPKTSHRPESEASGGGHVAFVVCYCGGYASTAHQMGHAETVQAAIAEVVEKWNTRAQLPSQGGEAVEVVPRATGGLYVGFDINSKPAPCLSQVSDYPRTEDKPVAMKTHGAWDGLDDLADLPDGTKLYTHPVDQVAEGVQHARDSEELRSLCAARDQYRDLSIKYGDKLSEALQLLTRCQENLHPHRDAALWSDVCAALGPKP